MQGLTIAAPVGEFRFATLAENRQGLVAENQLFQSQLNGGGNLSAAQQARLNARQAEFGSRLAGDQLEVTKLNKELTQVNIQIDDARNQLAVETNILNRIEPVVREGGIAEVQLLQQQQKVAEREATLKRLLEEKQRIDAAIAQAQTRTQNTVFTSQDELYTRIAENEKRIADIDSQLTKAILENEKQIESINSQLEQLEQTLEYQQLRAPKGGTIFDLQPTGPGFVANTSEPILKIVPNDNLKAQVFVTNQDIGFVTTGMEVDVRVDAYPYSEFDDIDGTITQIGSDALPPDEVYQFYRFPVTVELSEQMITADDREFPLQSGMSVNANIKTRKRRVITIFTDLFTRKVDTLKTGG
jgi:HlyD family secretion protein